jgi:hypothetical protein
MPTYQTFTAIGMREDLADVIYDISPTDTPIMSSIGKTSATAVYHEWQTDSLAAATTANAAVEGADATSATMSPTTRVGNYTQIIQKTVQVSGTLDKVNKAGRKSEKAYQLAKASAELKRDLETIITANQGKSAGTSTVARTMGSLLSWIKTNSDQGAGGSAPAVSGTSTRTDGTQRTATEALLKVEIASIFDQGGSPKAVFVGSAGKQKISTFPGIAVNRYQITKPEAGVIISAADIYLSDFGQISIVPDRFMRNRDMLILDPEYAAMAYLRPFMTNELAKNGDSEKTQILAEVTLEVKNEAAHGIVADLNFAL